MNPYTYKARYEIWEGEDPYGNRGFHIRQRATKTVVATFGPDADEQIIAELGVILAEVDAEELLKDLK